MRLTEYFARRQAKAARTPHRPRPAKRPWYISAETARKIATLPPVPKFLAAAYANLGGIEVASTEPSVDRQRNAIGPLDPRYTTDGLSTRQHKAGRMTQLLALMRTAYKAGDRATYDRLIRPFDAAARAIEGKGWGRDCRELSFPEWTNG